LDGVGFGVLPHGIGWINRAATRTLPKMMQAQMLMGMMKNLGAGQHLPTADAIDRLVDWVEAPDSTRRTLGGLEFTPKQQTIWIYPEAERPWPARELLPGDHLIDGRWHLRLSHPARVMPLGNQGFAMVKRHHKARLPLMESPARAFWRWPKLQIATNSTIFRDDDGLITLEDGGIIPHLSKNIREQSPSRSAEMRFIGGDGFD